MHTKTKQNINLREIYPILKKTWKTAHNKTEINGPSYHRKGCQTIPPNYAHCAHTPSTGEPTFVL